MKQIQISMTAGLLACMACLGCGEDWHAETHPATGRVTINGQPPEGALVHLYPAGEKVDVRNSRPWGVVQEDGTFTLTTYELGDGAPEGEYHFTIVWPFDPKVPSPTDRLGYKYSRPEQSQWQVTVEEGQNDLPLVEITNVAVNRDPQSRSAREAAMPSGFKNAVHSSR